MAFKVKLLLDSISPEGVRLVTFKTRFPREILCEVNTHCILSKSASSSRAIPGQKLRDFVRDNLYYPEFGSNKPGMQAGDEIADLDNVRRIWEAGMRGACATAEMLDSCGVHKQVVNRLVENFGWTNQVITGTEWANFFALRTHKDAHPAFRTLARAMYVAFSRSTPEKLDYNEWHLPFVGQGNLDDLSRHVFDHEFYAEMPAGFDREKAALYRSVACCARVSYQTLDGSPSSITKDFRTCEKLLKEPPYHVSPFQHQATPQHPLKEFAHPEQRSNLRGWLQYRKLIPNENITVFSPSDEEVASWGIPEDVYTD